MNQIDRITQHAHAVRTIAGLNRQLFYLKKDEKKLADRLMNKNTTPEEHASAQFDLDKLIPKIAAVEDRRFQMHRFIDELDAEAARQANIRLISETRDHAQIVITYERDDGKKVSYTRHIHWDGSNWRGLSTVSANRVIYHPSRAASQQQAA